MQVGAGWTIQVAVVGPDQARDHRCLPAEASQRYVELFIRGGVQTGVGLTGTA
jgi:hypothetical protein